MIRIPLLAFQLFSFLAFVSAASAAATIISPFGSPSTLNVGLTAYFQLEEGSGTRIDSEPTGTPHAMQDNATVSQAAGKVGNAALFASASSEFLSETDSVDISVANNDFARTLWIKFASIGSSQTPLAHWSTTSGNRSWRVHYDSGTGKLQWIVSDDGLASVTREATSFGTPTTGVWYFVYVFHDAANNLIGISVNDGTVNTVAHTTGVHNSTGAFTIGATANTFFFDGAIDEVCLWNSRILTTAEVTEAYNAGLNGLQIGR
jgi:hypothetical protein